MHLEPLDLARLALGTAVLSFASYTDWRWRRAPDALGPLVGGAGLALAGLQAGVGGAPRDAGVYIAVAAAFAGMSYGLYRLGLLAGGADAKALMALALLVPFPVHLGAFPVQPSLLPPAFAVLGNALLAFLAVPVGILAVNLARRHVAWPFSFLAVRMPLEEARRRHVWPMEHVRDGRVRRVLMPSRFLWEEEDWDALAALGRRDVWVTPKVPFMLPLVAGLVAAFLVGDLLFTSLLPGMAP